ncbi:hypothetical protein DFH07DRAFT_162241 [Mycena maculata]|uniref:DUF1365-domain-containing protein n=1 Tax=Mycena maculata TaxID=230809 RepID=A0AAD7MU28_9AGAR|nr:hypothetical protein DFH07DRAFT_162241 [Mycena maculata]
MATISCPRGYVLENQVTHARLFPVDSTHAFTYPTLSLLLSLNALENHSLDLGRGWIFGYGGRWARLVGLRPAPYLAENGASIRQRLEKVLSDRGFAEGGLEDAWMMTMPSLLGFEGINPLTVYFCYRPSGHFFLTVLEVHNTFGESHVYCLETDKGEDKIISGGFDHQWTFPRAFHVSPFNDRRGFYTVSIKTPSHSPMAFCQSGTPPPAPRPSVCVHLHTQTDDSVPTPGPLKLTALLRPISAAPLTSLSLLSALSRAPFDLFLSFARIVYVAWILHYQKHLDVFIRPEPVPTAWTHPIEGGVRWIPAGPFERYAQYQVHAFLRRRAQETGVAVTLVSSDPSVPPATFSPGPNPKSSALTIQYLSPRFFTFLLLCPSAAHALLLGKTERIFTASPEALFLATFASPAPTPQTPLSRRQQMRRAPLPPALPLPVPARHPLDTGTLLSASVSAAVLWLLLFVDRLEEWVFRAVRARPVQGTEPWGQWERAVRAHGGAEVGMPREAEGSVRRA